MVAQRVKRAPQGEAERPHRPAVAAWKCFRPEGGGRLHGFEAADQPLYTPESGTFGRALGALAQVPSDVGWTGNRVPSAL